ncbi:hypothetical protein ABTX81_05400 [Kitasatospora sp. NPDC097605]|uniref:hypothetical protein n=1 Tax=Kitasatospora sp. NPDC097605 TaxID=3157226 RepID=UPI00332F56DD
MRSSLVAPVAEDSAPVFGAILPAGFPAGFSAAAPVPTPAPGGPASTPGRPASPAAGSVLRSGGSPVWPEPVPPSAVGEQLDVSIRSLTGTWETRADGGYLDFEVTWTNPTQQRYDEVVPVVRVLPYDYPDAVARPGTTAKGMLDRKDLDEWREVRLDQAGVGSGPQQGAFALDPGERRTVRYRLTLAAGGMSGRLPITAEGWTGRGADAVRVGGTLARVNVTVVHPVGVSLSRPTEATMGKVSSWVRMELANVDGFAGHTVAPALAATDLRGGYTTHGLVPEDLIAETLVDGEWLRLKGALDAEGLVRLDTAGLSRALRPGETAVYWFRVNVPAGWQAGSGLQLTVGHSVDGQAMSPRYAQVPLTS